MSPTLRQLLPVGISITIIIAVAILRNYSKTLPPILATMPINLPLALWIFASADDTTPASLEQTAERLMINILPTVLFCVVAWLCIRAGWSLLPTIVAGYVAWGAFLGVLILIRGGL
ncbi:MAG: hypothetical protein KF726_18515 [Anaerolineae bacterium]|nr:hypothetical protein [Anaerolineae bacterium]